MWAWALGLLGKVPRKLLVYAGIAAAVAVGMWRVYDAGYDAARDQCKEASLRATVEALQEDLDARDALAQRRAAEGAQRRDKLRGALADMREDYENASKELQRCGDMRVPDAVYQRLLNGAGAGGEDDGSGKSDNADTYSGPFIP